MAGYNDNYRYSFSGADARAFAWFPQGGDYHRLLRLQDEVAHWWARSERFYHYDVPERDEARTKLEEAKIELEAVFLSIAPIHLQSIHTASVSVHEGKVPVRSLGHQNVRGFTRSARTIAGSLIFTVIEGHPLETLMIADPSTKDPSIGEWALDRWEAGVGDSHWQGRMDHRISTKLPPFNLYIEYVTEMPGCALAGMTTPYTKGQFLQDTPDHLLTPKQRKLKKKTLNTPLGGDEEGYLLEPGVGGTLGRTADPSNLVSGYNAASLLLLGIELIDQGMVTSVNDMVTEITYSFLARDYRDLSRIKAPKQDLPEHVEASAVDALKEDLNWCQSTIRERNQWTRANWSKKSGSPLSAKDKLGRRVAANKNCQQQKGKDGLGQLRHGEVTVTLDQTIMTPQRGDKPAGVKQEKRAIDIMNNPVSPLPPNCYWNK